MAIKTAWVIGSVKGMNYNVTIVGSPSTTVTGSRYLYHPTSSRSLLGGMVSAMSLSGVDNPIAVLTRDRKVRLSATEAFAVDWGGDPTLMNLLGFTGDLPLSLTHTATNVSPLLFSPGKPLLSELSPRGTLGIRRPLAYYTMSPSDGSTFVVSHGDRTDQRFSASHVDIERVFTSDEAGGEWVRWFDEVAAKGYQFYVYLDVNEEAGSSAIASLSDGLGPYVWVPSARAPSWDYRRARGFDWTDFLADVSLPCRDAPEYS
ncbi:hypothetical protein [Nannocystis punicea]|uniref:Uncharacterized protein n=1 Tax=Nannocystis punicea TaxID=2995304 RepID=A0ABY7H9T6_9BACT|nr:hypothetical protein [Nannocystis poenicansa]WAS96036.1 hypothetical protein O0S08_07715 [Nannocystis poenicansa]